MHEIHFSSILFIFFILFLFISVFKRYKDLYEDSADENTKKTSSLNKDKILKLPELKVTV